MPLGTESLLDDPVVSSNRIRRQTARAAGKISPALGAEVMKGPSGRADDEFARQLGLLTAQRNQARASIELGLENTTDAIAGGTASALDRARRERERVRRSVSTGLGVSV